MRNRLINAMWFAVPLAAMIVGGMAESACAGGPGLHGRVFALDEGGHYAGVVGGARIEFKDQAGNIAAEVTSGSNGYYRTDLAPGNYTYKVEAEGYQTEDEGRGLVLQHSEGYEVHDFPLSPEQAETEEAPYEPAVVPMGRLAGHVFELTEKGERVGIPDARVSLRHADSRELRSVVTRRSLQSPEENGGYSLKLPAGTWRAAVTAEGFEPFVDPDPIEVPSDGIQNQGLPMQLTILPPTATRDFVLKRTVPETPTQQGIRGLVLVPRGVVMPEVEVRINGVMTPSAADEPLRADEKGRFSRDLATGKYRVIANAEGFRPAMRPLVMVYPGRYTDVELRLVPEGGEQPGPVEQQLLVAVTVGERTPQGVQGIPNARVLLRAEGQELRDAPTQTTNEQGKVEFKVDAGAAGPYTVLAQAEGYTPGGARFRVGPEEPNSAEVLLQKPAGEELVAVTGYVAYRDERSPTGQYAIPGARLFWRSRETQELVASAQSEGEHGSYEVSLPEGEYRVEVAGPERFQPTTEAVTVRRGMRPRTFVLERREEGTPPLRAVEFAGDVVTPSPVLRGRFVGVPGAVIHWASTAGADVTVNAARDGSFASRLYPGTYRAGVSAPGFRGITQNVVVEAGMDPVRFVLSRGEAERGLATLTLRVVERVESPQRLPFRPRTGLLATRPVPNAEVRIVSGRDVVSSGQTDDQGIYSADLQPASYAILVAKQGYDTAREQVLLTDRGETTEIVLAKAAQTPPRQKRLLTLRVVEQVVKPQQAEQQQQQQQQPERRPQLQTTPRTRQSSPGADGSGQQGASSDNKENLLPPSARRSPLQQLQDRFRQRLEQGRDTGQSSQQVIQPVLGATVSIFQGQTEVDHGQTDRDGMYRVQLDPGSYVVRVSRTGFDTAQQSVIIADRDVTRQIVLRRQQQQRGPD